jgi:hypothetical protein
MTQKELILNLLTNIKSDITQVQYEKGIIASGRSAASLQEQATEKTGELLGSKSFDYQEFGRPPGKQPPTGTIARWIEDKRLTPPNGWTVMGFAYVIARKIGLEGTRIWRDKSLGIPITQIITDNVDRFAEDLGESLFNQISDQIMKSFKQA